MYIHIYISLTMSVSCIEYRTYIQVSTGIEQKPGIGPALGLPRFFCFVAVCIPV